MANPTDNHLRTLIRDRTASARKDSDALLMCVINHVCYDILNAYLTIWSEQLDLNLNNNGSNLKNSCLGSLAWWGIALVRRWSRVQIPPEASHRHIVPRTERDPCTVFILSIYAPFFTIIQQKSMLSFQTLIFMRWT